MQLNPIWKPSTSQKETSPLDRYVINSLPHKSAAFVPQCVLMETTKWKPQYKTIKWKPASQKETSPLAHFVRNSLPHKSFHFCSPMLLWKPRSENHHHATAF